MNFDFELILFYLTIISGALALFDILFLAKKRRAKKGVDTKPPLLFEYARSFFPVFLIVFLLRSFLFEPFRIPSPSLEPTLLTGDFILVNKFNYGLRLPIISKKIVDNGEPKRGDILVFRWPADRSYDFIKRVIGLPGDTISYINKELIINGQKIPQENVPDKSVLDNPWHATTKKEDLLGVKHDIYVVENKETRNFENIVVPPHMYFVMGDNRDESADSRYWGFVPEKNILGKAVRVLISWNKDTYRLRWSRFWEKVN